MALSPSGRTASVVNGVSSISFSTAKPASRAVNRYAAPERFIAGPENRLACLAAESVLRGEMNFNPLVFTGPANSGKTHLARGLAAAYAHSHADSGFIVVTAAEFSQQFGRAIQDDTVSLFRRGYRTSKFVVLEDLAGLVGKPTAQQELRHTIDALLDQGAQFVTTCREPLARMSGLMPGLRSRLSTGLEVLLAFPELAARVTLLEELAAVRGTAISKSAVRSLAEAVRGSVPELLGALTALESAGSHALEPIQVSDVEAYLHHQPTRPVVTLQTLCSRAARHFGLKVGDLKSPSRERTVVLARGVAMFLARQTTDKTLIEIGSFFGGRDHSTVLHGLRQIERLVHCDAETRHAIETLQADLNLAHRPNTHRILMPT